VKRVAVASDDGRNVATHFGRCRYFVVYDVEDSRVVNREARENRFTQHARGGCGGSDEQPHSHAGIVEALSGCDAVLCRGMGWRAAEELGRNGITPTVLSRETDADGAVADYIAGATSELSDFCCGRSRE